MSKKRKGNDWMCQYISKKLVFTGTQVLDSLFLMLMYILTYSDYSYENHRVSKSKYHSRRCNLAPSSGDSCCYPWVTRRFSRILGVYEART